MHDRTLRGVEWVRRELQPHCHCTAPATFTHSLPSFFLSGLAVHPASVPRFSCHSHALSIDSRRGHDDGSASGTCHANKQESPRGTASSNNMNSGSGTESTKEAQSVRRDRDTTCGSRLCHSTLQQRTGAIKLPNVSKPNPFYPLNLLALPASLEKNKIKYRQFIPAAAVANNIEDSIGFL